MTRGRGLLVFTVVGMAVIGAGLGSKSIIARLRSEERGEPGRLGTTSIDLAAGAGQATLSAHDMGPGDTTAAAITMSNSGARPITYAMSHDPVPADGLALAAALRLTVKTAGTSCADFDGTTLFDGSLDEAAFGGDENGRPLPAATAEILCFRVTLPSEAGNRFQAATAIVTLTFGSTLQGAVQ
jgi:hypothetical protein